MPGPFGLGSPVSMGGRAPAPSGFIFSPPTASASPGFSFPPGNAPQPGPPAFKLGSVGSPGHPTALSGLAFASAAAAPASPAVPPTQPLPAFGLGGPASSGPAAVAQAPLQASGFKQVPPGALGPALQAPAAPGLAFASAAAAPASPAVPPTQPLPAFGLGGPASSGPAAVAQAPLQASGFKQVPPGALGPALQAPAAPGPKLFAPAAASALQPVPVGRPMAGAPALGMQGFGLKPLGSPTVATSIAQVAPASALKPKPPAPQGAAFLPGPGAALRALPSAGFLPGPGPGPGTPTLGRACLGPVQTYAQLENLINKWSLELEAQEKHFLHQATQVNAWDRSLLENGERIMSLHREVEKVKLDQRRLDQELDFILAQQKELEELLAPLEDAVREQGGSIYLQHADEERERTYQLAETIDAQLKRMARDLKDVIEHLNAAGGPPDAADPLQQVCRILNAHTDSLQWVDQNSALLQRKVEEVAKVFEDRRKEQERGYGLAFD
ncbi:nuclear pore glycoprotein p62 [Gracilinanus agilis]|uniref:nuclear pore glycoprotein p62 n=1 Tax=Gracilinanus agilis TaxID=191870 RepID=UPI001CFECEF5|nr:nuclear pore glycoprotein p62 [Gracilinanus agilis]